MLFFCIELPAQTHWQVNQYDIGFKIKNFGFNVNGSFKGLKATIHFDPNQLSKSSIKASIAVETIHTGINARDKHLRKDDFFGVERYPTIQMESKRFEKVNATSFVGHFEVKIRDKRKTIQVPFQFKQKGNQAHLEGNFSINRLEFGVGGRSMSMSNEARVFVEMEVVKR